MGNKQAERVTKIHQSKRTFQGISLSLAAQHSMGATYIFMLVKNSRELNRECFKLIVI